MIELKLVDNVTPFPTDFIPSVANGLRAFADCLEDGSVDARRAVIITQDSAGIIDCTAFGERIDIAHAVGLIELGKAGLIDGAKHD